MVTNRSSGWRAGSSRGPTGPAFIASHASNSSRVNSWPPKGGANQRARTKRDSLPDISSRASADTVFSIATAFLRSSAQATGSAQILLNRFTGRASSDNSLSTSATSSHMSVSGSSERPVTMASAKKMPLMPPALEPATISLTTRSRSSALSSIQCSRSRYTCSVPGASSSPSAWARLARSNRQTSFSVPCM